MINIIIVIPDLNTVHFWYRGKRKGVKFLSVRNDYRHTPKPFTTLVLFTRSQCANGDELNTHTTHTITKPKHSQKTVHRSYFHFGFVSTGMRQKRKCVFGISYPVYDFAAVCIRQRPTRATEEKNAFAKTTRPHSSCAQCLHTGDSRQFTASFIHARTSRSRYSTSRSS